MRRAAPELFRPQGAPGQRLARAAMAAGGLLNLVLWVFVLVLEVRGEVGAYPGLSAALVVTTWLLVVARRIRRLPPPSDRLSELVSSLPGEPRIPVVSGWRGPVAQIGVVNPGRPVIWVAPPVAAALTETELRAVLAHEVAHVQHRDLGWRVQRRILLGLCGLAAVAALYGIPALRSLAGLHGRLSAQAGPFLLAAWYLVFRILYAMELRATRAEERAADRGMLSLIGDPDACADGIGKVSHLLGVPDAWTLPQRLLFATHPATSERLRLLRDPAAVAAYVQPRATTRGRVVRRRLLTGVLVLGAVLALVEVSAHRVIAMPADAGKYQLLLPRSLDGARLDTTSADAVHLRSSAWGSGYLVHFTGAVPVTAVYDQDGQTWLYVWGAYGKLANPSGELSAFWNKLNSGPFGALAFPDTESAGPLGGYLQCYSGSLTCVWADNSGIVVVSLPPPGELGDLAFLYTGPQVTEQQLAGLTRSLRSVAEVPVQRRLEA